MGNKSSKGMEGSSSCKNTTFAYLGPLCDKELDELKTAYHRGGIEEVAALIQHRMENTEAVTLDIAVTGDTGAGKSTLINVLRSLLDDDEGAAPTGVVETTKEPKAYAHPSLPSVQLWDLPGIGTTNFMAKNYLEQIKFDCYDFFLLISSCRFTENDAKLAQEIERLGKHFYFVRTKLDVDVNSTVGQRRRIRISEDEIVNQIRQDCIQHLQNAGMQSQQVFLLSSFELHKYDFENLQKAISENLSEIKKQVLWLSLPNVTSEVIKQKTEVLRRQIWGVAAMSAGIAALPIPGLSFTCDLGILVTTVIHFREYLGLDARSIEMLAIRVNKPANELKSKIQNPLLGDINKANVLKLLASVVYVGSMFAEEALRFLPFLGQVLSASVSFATTYKMLSDALDSLDKSAQELLKAAIEI